jgi:hypothetical protein
MLRTQHADPDLSLEVRRRAAVGVNIVAGVQRDGQRRQLGQHHQPVAAHAHTLLYIHSERPLQICNNSAQARKRRAAGSKSIGTACRPPACKLPAWRLNSENAQVDVRSPAGRALAQQVHAGRQLAACART